MQIMLRERKWQSLVITRFVESMVEATVINRSLEKKQERTEREKDKTEREGSGKKERIINHPEGERRNHVRLKTRRNKSDDHWKTKKKGETPMLCSCIPSEQQKELRSSLPLYPITELVLSDCLYNPHKRIYDMLYISVKYFILFFIY